MKILTILGTRPEIIRLSRVISTLDVCSDHVLVHTGQNFDPNLSDIFFNEMDIRKPDYYLEVRGTTFAEQIGQIITTSESVLSKEKPDRVLILGDTNSGLAALVAKRMGVPVYHMEAGNRCFDDRVPEEVNRRVIDQCSDILMPYTERSRQNLLREGIPGHRIFVTGNPIFEVISFYQDQIDGSDVLARLAVTSGGYFLVTMHREENVDVEHRLQGITNALALLHEEFGVPVVVSTHPRTRVRMKAFGIDARGDIRFLEPFSFFDFITLEKNARCVLSDSGTVQEECCIFRVPNVTLRDVTERPETVECGSNILSGTDQETIARSVKLTLERRYDWTVPPEYVVPHVSDTVRKIIMGHYGTRRRLS